MKQYFVEIDKIKTRVTEWGSRDKPVIFCLHGMGCTGVHFIEIVDKLIDNYCIIAPDLPGFGQTEPFRNSDDYGFPLMANWINELVKKLNLEEFYLLTHSWGANVGLFYIAEFSEKVKKLLMLDGAYFIKSMVLEYNLKHNNILFDCNTLEECIKDEKEWFYEVYGGRKYKNLDKYIEDEKIDYSRWTPNMEKAHLETAIFKEGNYVFHATAETGIAILKAFYNFPSSLVYKKIRSNEIYKKIILLASTCIPDVDWTEITEMMIDKFENESGAEVKKVHLPHMMHWEDPKFIIDEILRIFK